MNLTTLAEKQNKLKNTKKLKEELAKIYGIIDVSPVEEEPKDLASTSAVVPQYAEEFVNRDHLGFGGKPKDMPNVCLKKYEKWLPKRK